MVAEDILLEIDATLDRLIQNVEAIAQIEITELTVTEIEAFQKTQESLVQHLLHTDQRLEAHRKALSKPDERSASFKIAEKRKRFETLSTSYDQIISETIEEKVPILLKRRCKRFLSVQ